MANTDPSLFQIGEAARLMEVTRKMILNYENLGLLTPAYRDEASGYRYYSAENLTQIRSIRGLQGMGLSLQEVRGYYRDTASLDECIKRLTELREQLDRNIRLLQIRAARRGDMTVWQVTLPAQVCFCRRAVCRSIAEAAAQLRDTYIAAARTGLISIQEKLFTVRMGEDPDVRDLLCCIPMREDYAGPERAAFRETQAICVYYRGAYEGMSTAFAALKDYWETHRLQPAGNFRAIYMEGPPNRGSNTAEYITQLAIPVEPP